MLSMSPESYKVQWLQSLAFWITKVIQSYSSLFWKIPNCVIFVTVWMWNVSHSLLGENRSLERESLGILPFSMAWSSFVVSWLQQSTAITRPYVPTPMTLLVSHHMGPSDPMDWCLLSYESIFFPLHRLLFSISTATDK